MTTITISGTPGSGKSTIGDILHKKIGVPYVYSGMIFRDTAKKYKMSLEDFGKYCETHSEIDKELDDKQLTLLKKGNIILEGRLAGWIAYRNNIPSFKVMLDADITTRAKRIVNREQGDLDQRKNEMLKREKSEMKRYKHYYDIDLKDKTIYDLVIDTSDKSPDEIAEIIVKKINI